MNAPAPDEAPAPQAADAAAETGGREGTGVPEPLSRGRLAGVVALVILLSVAVYAISLRGKMGHWDDKIYVTGNPLILAPSWKNTSYLLTHVYFSHWYPLTMLSYVADYALWGLDPLGYHLTSLVLHVISGVLVFLVMRRIAGENALALITAALFVVAPTAVESVAWISERKNVLCMAFWLAGYLFYLRSRSMRESPGAYWLAVMMNVLACMSKAQGITLAAVVGLTELLLRRRRLWPAVLQSIPFGVVSTFFLVLNMMTATASVRPEYHGGSFIATMTTNIKVLVAYVHMLVLPVGPVPPLGQMGIALSPVYHVPTWAHPFAFVPVGWLGGIKLPLPLLAAGLLAFLVWGSLKVVGRPRLVLFLWGWFIVNLLPVLNIVPIPWLKQDRYLYFPSAGALLLLVLVLREGARKLLATEERWRPAFRVAVIGLIVAHAAIATVWARKWSVPKNLWLVEARAKAPQEYPTWHGAGDAARHNREWKAAAGCYFRAMELLPHDYQKLTRARLSANVGGCLFNLGLKERNMRLVEEGLTHIARAEEIVPDEPVVIMVIADRYTHAARMALDPVMRRDRARKAVAAYERAVKNFTPGAPDRVNRAQAYQLSGEPEKALELLEEIRREYPGYTVIHQHIGSVLDDLGRTEDAMAAFRKGLELDPGEPGCSYNLGVAHQRLGDYREARRLYSTAAAGAPAFRAPVLERYMEIEHATSGAGCPGSMGAF